MPSLMPDKIDDLVRTQLESAVRRQWVNLTQKYNYYTFVERMLAQEETSMRSHKVTWIPKVKRGQNARHTGLYDKDELSAKNLTDKAEMEWAFQQSGARYDVREIALMDSLTSIVDYVDIRVFDAWETLFDLMEEGSWSAPTGDSATARQFAGIPFWLQKSTATTPEDFGFNGGDPSGFSNGAGNISVSDVPEWKNGTFTFTNMSDDDGLEKLSKAMDFTQFRPPRDFNELGAGFSYVTYGSYAIKQELERLLDTKNDNHGIDAMRFRGMLLLRGIPFEWVPVFDNEGPVKFAEDRIYLVNWNTFRWITLEGFDMALNGPHMDPDSHNVRNMFIDNSGQLVCYNRRSNAVGHRV